MRPLLTLACCVALLVGATAARAARPALCHTKAPQQVPANGWAAAQSQLAPPGASAIRLCRYSGLNDHPRLRVVRATLLTRQVWVQKLIREFDDLPAPPPGPTACPADLGTEIVAQIAYPDGHAVTISVEMTGCVTVTNGSVTRTAAGFGSPPQFGPKLVLELEHLTGYRP